MSTVQELYNDLVYHIGDEADILSIMNNAVRIIAKRLYWHKSDMITNIMEVPIHPAVTLTASDIAFVNSNPDTITSGANAFIFYGFHAGMPIITSNTPNPGPFHVETVAAGTLTLNSLDSLVTYNAGQSTLITSDDAYGFLPDDFWGLSGRPYLDGLGQSGILIPLPSIEAELSYLSAGLPRYYKIRKNKLYVIPHTATAYTVKADYFSRPTKLTELTDTLPFDELFDDLIGELTVRLFKSGSSISTTIEDFCNRSVDLVAVQREKKAPVSANRGIDYGKFL